MKLTAEQLSLHLAHGDWVAMKRGDYWKVFMHETFQGEFQGTVIRINIEDCLEDGLDYEIIPRLDIEEYYYTEYKIIKPAPKLMKAGDKCQIIDTPELRKLTNGWTEESAKAIIGVKGLEIAGLVNYNFHYKVRIKDKTDFYLFPYWAVARDFSEEEVSLSGKEVTVIFDGKEYDAVIK